MKFNQLVSLLESSKRLEVSDFNDYKYYNWSGALRADEPYRFEIIYVDENGFIHKDDGPAYSRDPDFVNGEKGKLADVKRWYKHGRLHRLDGPAIINDRGWKEWFINGEEYSEEEFNEYIKGLESKEDLDMLSDLGQTFD